MALSIPKFSRFRFAREGLVSENGRLPADWSVECISDLMIDEIDLGPGGPAMSITITDVQADAEYFSVVLGGYHAVSRDDIGIVTFETRFSGVENVAGAFAVVREWVAGGEYIGQATRPVSLHGEAARSVVARGAGGVDRVLQPLLSLRRKQPGPVRLTVRLSRVVFGSLYEHTDWLATPAG